MSKVPKAKHREHGQIKKHVSVVVTQDSLEGLDKIAESFGVSRSHLVEMIGRGQVSLANQLAQVLGK